jgi:transposase-like protein
MLMVAHRTKSEWAEIVEAYKESGQSQTAFCREHGINAKTLGNHLHKRVRKKQSTKRNTTKRSAEEWLALIEEQRASGMNRAAWCRENGINVDAMGSAEKRLSTRLSKESEPVWLELTSDVGMETIPLQKDSTDWGIKIRNGDLEIEVNAGYSVDKLAALIERLVKQ